jgi:hypothetical protein
MLSNDQGRSLRRGGRFKWFCCFVLVKRTNIEMRVFILQTLQANAPVLPGYECAWNMGFETTKGCLSKKASKPYHISHLLLHKLGSALCLQRPRRFIVY